jgi:hypothetical protein
VTTLVPTLADRINQAAQLVDDASARASVTPTDWARIRADLRAALDDLYRQEAAPRRAGEALDNITLIVLRTRALRVLRALQGFIDDLRP